MTEKGGTVYACIYKAYYTHRDIDERARYDAFAENR